MGTLVGHVLPGFGFFAIGLWHLFNHLRLLALNKEPKYKSLLWFPSNFRHLRYLELYLIMTGCFSSVAMELFIGPNRHQPFDTDGTIPSNHLQNFEHSFISLSFFVYAFFALALDKWGGPSLPAQYDVIQIFAALAFGQQLLLFHLHSADHLGVEGQYHWLLQLVIFISLFTTILGIAYQGCFVIAFTRSLSIIYQGVWQMVMGFALWTPSLISKGCFIHEEEGHQVVKCDEKESLYRAKALVNIQFSWFLILLAVFAVSFYVIMMKIYGDNMEYSPMALSDLKEEDVEAQKMGGNKNLLKRIVL
ncbi:transmembrane protein 45A-like [Chenopodium quinoa]|uniref:transmembrane protein 45A-like n=1 Tax=Chenopodium quinoa TaxID=63459 RepID=UPI000B781D08|nr:transmembrane protein 45A-like [Chenopodium quinoa]